MKINRRRFFIDDVANCIFMLQNNKNNTTCQKPSPEIIVRATQNIQLQIGEIDVSEITIELNNRDEIPQLLRGIQFIYKNNKLLNSILKIMKEIFPENTSLDNGRPGMTLWQIFVLGALRLNCKWDYDKLQEIANNHITLRKMLGHGILDDQFIYHRQTLNDNLSLFTREALDRINTLVTEEGIRLTEKLTDAQTDHGRCDSFVVETDVHFPTDINLLWDAVRKTITLSSKIADKTSTMGWRQAKHNLRKLKSLFRKVQIERDRNKASTAALNATREYVDSSMEQFRRAEDLIHTCVVVSPTQHIVLEQIRYFVACGKKQIDQILRRCFKGETIPHGEKVFSLFEPHTEWIVKGKAGITQELGLRVCILESNTGFILHHKVMQKETDDAVAIEMVKKTIEKFPCIKGVSFDKGFHSPENQNTLRKDLVHCVLPRKGNLDSHEKAYESTRVFVERRKKHAAVESAINALENHGLGRCLDLGIDGFKRYVGLAVLARNIQLIGALLRYHELQKYGMAA